jgi:hypothetical protein
MDTVEVVSYEHHKTKHYGECCFHVRRTNIKPNSVPKNTYVCLLLAMHRIRNGNLQNISVASL